MTHFKWIFGIGFAVILLLMISYFFRILIFYPNEIKKSKIIADTQKNNFDLITSKKSICQYFNNLDTNTGIKTIEKNLSLAPPINRHMGSSLYNDRTFQYYDENGTIQIGLKAENLLFNGDYIVKYGTDTCENWNKNSVPTKN